MAFNAQLSQTPTYADLPFYNYSSSVTISAGTAVSVDSTNVIGGANEGVGIVPIAAVGNVAVGVAMESIPPLSYGRVRTAGTVAMTADGAITAGAVVDGSNTANKTAKSHTATKFQIGVALSTAADGEAVLVLLCLANNA